ncbi:MAG: hypothetical protein OEV59_04320 [Deltaproteobacteria bacterium]|nr:hypothetical protein [Deltaproteobacteria bacterium]
MKTHHQISKAKAWQILIALSVTLFIAPTVAADVLTYYTVRHWEGYGFSRASTLEWREQGFGLNEAKIWRAAAFDPHRAYYWKKDGFTGYDAKPWKDAGLDSREAKHWRNSAFEPKDATEWKSAGFDITEARNWKSAGFTPAEATRWRTAFSAFRAKELRDSGISLDAAKRRQNEGGR